MALDIQTFRLGGRKKITWSCVKQKNRHQRGAEKINPVKPTKWDSELTR